MLAFAAAFAAFLVSACDERDRDGLRTELETARDRWTNTGWLAYAVTQRRICFCPLPSEWTVVVEAGLPSFIESVETTSGTADTQRDLERRALEQSLSVEQLFDWIDARIDNVAQLDVTFDPELGYPTNVTMDAILDAVDDEITWELSDVVPLGPCTEIACSEELRVVLRSAGGRLTAGNYVITVTPAVGALESCSFSVMDGGSCTTSPCVQSAGCPVLLVGPDRVEVSLPVVAGTTTVTVSIDGAVVATEAAELIYTRAQPNGPLCPPVCWFAQHEVALP